MSLLDTMFNWSGRTAAKVLQGGSYTVPDSVTVASPTSSLLASPAGNADTQRAVVGGQIVSGFSDAAGPAHPDTMVFQLQPGDVVACSAVASGKITVTVTQRSGAVVTLGTIAATAVGGVLIAVG